MKNIYLKLVLSLLILSSAHSFTLVGSSIAQYEDGAIDIYIGSQNCNEVEESPDELMDLTEQAISKFWNTVSTSSLDLSVVGRTSVDSSFYTDQICGSSSVFRGVNDYINDKGPALSPVAPSSINSCIPKVSRGILIVCNDNGTTFNTGSKIAVTIPNNTSGNTIVGSIIAINDTATTAFNNLSNNEKVSVIAHEIGHAIGLGHSAFKDSLLYPSSIEGRNKLGRDDWDGATYIYPKEQGPTGLCGTIRDVNDNSKAPLTMALALLLALFILSNKVINRAIK